MWTEAEHDFLSGQQIGRLATLGPEGPHVRPTGFRLNADRSTVDIGGAHLSKTRKWRNIATDGRVAFVVDDMGSAAEFRPRGVEVRGRAELVEDDEELIHVIPNRIISWGLDSDPFTPTARTTAAE